MANYATSSLKLSDTYVNTLPYNTCSTAAGTAAKTVSAGTFSLETGAMVVVKFTTTNTAANPTLNVSSTGAKAIYYNGAAITAGYLKANKVYQFIYNGTQWDLVGDVDTTGGIIEGSFDLTSAPDSSDGYKMGKEQGNIHFDNISNVNDTGNAITWSNCYITDSNPQAGIYVKSGGTYGTKMYLATTNLFNDGPKAALEIDNYGNITALRSKFVGNLNGNATSATTASSLAMSRGNEVNFVGNTTPTEIWFNYRDTTTDQQSGNTTPIQAYKFGNTNGTTSGVTLYADNFSGNAATATTLNGLTASVAELNHVKGVTSNIQTQLNNKINTSGGAFSGKVSTTAYSDSNGGLITPQFRNIAIASNTNITGMKVGDIIFISSDT